MSEHGAIFVSALTALGGVVLGCLGWRATDKRDEASVTQAQIEAMATMYRDLVNDLRSEIDRLQDENGRLRGRRSGSPFAWRNWNGHSIWHAP